MLGQSPTYFHSTPVWMSFSYPFMGLQRSILGYLPHTNPFISLCLWHPLWRGLLPKYLLWLAHPGLLSYANIYLITPGFQFLPLSLQRESPFKREIYLINVHFCYKKVNFTLFLELLLHLLFLKNNQLKHILEGHILLLFIWNRDIVYITYIINIHICVSYKII